MSNVLRLSTTRRGLVSVKHDKFVLPRTLGVAVRFDALETNPFREIVLPRRNKKAAATSQMVLTAGELPDLRKHLRSNKERVRWDLPDMIDVLSASGCRIRELPAWDWHRHP